MLHTDRLYLNDENCRLNRFRVNFVPVSELLDGVGIALQCPGYECFSGEAMIFI